MSQLKPDEKTQSNQGSARPRLLLVAFCCDQHESMEHRNGWKRALRATRHFDVTVLCGPQSNAQILNKEIEGQFSPTQLSFSAPPIDILTQKLLRSELLFYIGYRRWLKRIYEYAKQLDRESEFTTCHLVSLCGYRDPGIFWKLRAKFLWGPIGGTSDFPLRYLGIMDIRGGMFEVLRNVVNSSQLRLSSRIRRSMSKTTTLVSANRSTQRDLKKHFNIDSDLELETGIDFPVASPRPVRNLDRPFRILWAGRLRSWKGLPLLIHALAKVPSTIPIQVKVVGSGICKRAWKRLSVRLGVDQLVEWIDRPPYRDSLVHYQWADAFAFTSLRDTSGTGLLESLAMGAPIIGLDHQGSADIMTDESAIRVSIRNPATSIKEFSEAIVRLAQDPDLLKRLSDGARTRAEKFVWDHRQGAIDEAYQNLAKQSLNTRSQAVKEGLNAVAIAMPSLAIIFPRNQQSISQLQSNASSELKRDLTQRK